MWFVFSSSQAPNTRALRLPSNVVPLSGPLRLPAGCPQAAAGRRRLVTARSPPPPHNRPEGLEERNALHTRGAGNRSRAVGGRQAALFGSARRLPPASCQPSLPPSSQSASRVRGAQSRCRPSPPRVFLLRPVVLRAVLSVCKCLCLISYPGYISYSKMLTRGLLSLESAGS